jgi:predicted metal-binding membrane protein
MAQQSLTERLLKRDRMVLAGLLLALFSLAALYTVFGVGMRMTALEMTAMRDMRDMAGPGVAGVWNGPYALLVFLMWLVMMIAMMIPSVAPTILLQASLLRHSGRSAQVPRVSSAFLAGYIAVWAGFSLAATLTQWALEAAGLVSASMMTLINTWPGGLLLIAAGLFQFTPLKGACLAHCRSPVRFLTERRRPGSSGAFLMGAEHGVYCLGCCWILMALLFVGGIMNLYWIVGLAVFVALEKLTPCGETISKVLGSGLVIWGGIVLIEALPH